MGYQEKFQKRLPQPCQCPGCANPTRPNGFPNLAMGNPSSDRASQSLGSTYSTWQSNGIWGNGAISLNSRRDVTGSRDSDEHSPNTASGSAQLNSHSQAAPWASRSGIWNQPGSGQQGPSSSGSASPTRTRDGFQHNFTEVSSSSHLFQLRAPVGQNGSVSSGRALPSGPLDPSTSSFKYQPPFGDSAPDERGSTNMYTSNSSTQLDLETPALYRRDSNDPPFLNPGHSRQATLSQRQAEVDMQGHSHRYSENPQYPFSKRPSQPRSQPQRPSMSGNSVTLPSETGRSNPFGFGVADTSGHDLEKSFNPLTLEEPSDPVSGGYGSSGPFNPTSQPFQLNPGSQPWQNEINSRDFGHNMPESWAELHNSTLYSSKRGPGERESPAGSSYRPGMNSPRAYSGTPTNPRADPWSRPGSRDPRMVQELDRTQHSSQYLHQQSGFYQPPYYNGNVSQFSGPYDQYMQNPSYRSQMQLPGYGLMNYVPAVSMRPSRDQDPAKGVRSVLLEEFRGNAKSNKRYELKDIYNHIVEFSGDQHGSRFIQEKLQTANSDEKDQVFREIEPNTLQLMKDVFGNYVIQKFFEHGNQVQKKIIAGQMKGKVAELSTQMYACRVVQKALEHVLVEQQIEIVEELKPDIMRIVKDQNGNHVIQKIIQMVPRLCIPFIMDAFQSQIESLASHNYGCRVIQRILENGTEAEKTSLMADLHGCAARLITDQYGNYVTQHIIAHGEPDDQQQVIQLVLQKLLFYSKHKFASNVVEKSIEFGTAEDRKAITSQLTVLHSDGTSPLQHMMKDQFGNYVIQKLMQHLDSPDRESLIEEMRPHFTNLKKFSTGRQITALERLMSASSANMVNGVSGIASTSPTTPSLVIDINSAAPTPSLTMEENSPESSSPPSTKASMEECADEKNTKGSPITQTCDAVEVNEP
ncbi:ARM repeat-containing protein [Hypoxylon sp. NC1633]|nr:ARM repeat-containing protein [Hypoxylon sp. NC1633]